MTETETERFWNDLYNQREQLWSGRPNPVLAEVAGPLQPGTALDLGCGEGGDAIWLAGRGWRVTAVDVSPVALDRTAARAAAEGVADAIDFQRHDLAETFPEGSFDLVSAQFLQSPIDFPRDRVLRAAASAVAPGGLLLIVEHGAMPPWSRHPEPHPHFPTLAETTAVLALPPDRWSTELLHAPERQATGPDGESATLTDNVIAVRRLH